jgi:flagellar L-ring protein precursor FlgH
MTKSITTATGNRRPATAVIAIVATLVLAAPAFAQKKGDTPAKSDNYDELVSRYLSEARKQAAGESATASSWMNGLMGDLRARSVNDLLTVRVEESITASGTADSAVSKSGKATAGVPTLFGLETKLPSSVNPANLVSTNSDTSFKGAGTTTRAGALSARLTARVAEVLPNGDLFIEGVREIEINGDRQIVVLTGIARVADINQANVVPSAALGQLRIRYFGRGLIKDSLTPGWLIRVINKIF